MIKPLAAAALLTLAGSALAQTPTVEGPAQQPDVSPHVRRLRPSLSCRPHLAAHRNDHQLHNPARQRHSANDFQCFLNRFAAGDNYANCDATGGLTANDFQCFLNKFAAGCS